MNLIEVIEATKQAFLPHLEARRADIESVTRKTFRYGPAERHHFDVYYPPVDNGAPEDLAPVLFFIYGGGFVMGSRTSPPPFELVHANLGAFFANRRIITVIPDYRLAPEVTHPKGAEDVRDAITWFVQNASVETEATIFSQTGVQPDLTSLFLMGHSAGATHAASILLNPSLLLPQDVRQNLRGLILQGATFDFTDGRTPEHDSVLKLYFVSEEAITAASITVLLEHAPLEVVQALPDILVMVSEYEPGTLRVQAEKFVRAAEDKMGDKEVQFSVMERHNHISPHLALISGHGEEWGGEVEKYVKAKAFTK